MIFHAATFLFLRIVVLFVALFNNKVNICILWKEDMGTSKILLYPKSNWQDRWQIHCVSYPFRDLAPTLGSNKTLKNTGERIFQVFYIGKR